MTALNPNFNLPHTNLNKLNAAPIPAPANEGVSSSIQTLAQLNIGEQWLVSKIAAPAGAPEWAMQLEDIGFIAGEPVTLMARGAFGGDPLVVRIGVSTFALRLAEAACVHVKAMPKLATA